MITHPKPAITLRRLATIAAAILLTLLGPAQAALAHNTLTSSTPAKNSQIAQAPKTVTLTFNAQVQNSPGNQIVVTGPGGTRYTTSDDEVRADGSSAKIDLASLGKKGKYTIGYRVLSADGHVIQNQFSFTLTQDDSSVAPTSTPAEPSASNNTGQTAEQTAPEPQATAADQPETDDGLPLWVWIAGALVLLGAGLVFALRLGRD